MTGSSREGGFDEMPWASVFDPAANARALGAIQSEGFRAASRIVDRFASMARTREDLAQNGSATGHDGAAARPGPAPALPDFEQMTRAWWAVFGQFLLGADRGPGSVRSEFNLETPGCDRGIDLEVEAPGCAAAEVWLHNRGTTDFGEIRLRCSDLQSHGGDFIHSDEVTLDPPVVAMPPRCSRGVGVAVEVTDRVRPGTYRGTLLVGGHDGLWLPVALTVRSPAS